jgi:hypothetical protein
MKCDKCGFVSFDYLSECRRCSADLTGTRELLGFSTLKSEVPFLLGALLKGGGQREGLTKRVGAESEDPNKESASTPGAEELFNIESSGGEPAIAADLGAGPSPPAKEELIIELSEADLESLSGTNESVKGKEPRRSP